MLRAMWVSFAVLRPAQQKMSCEINADTARVQIWLECICYINLVALSAEKKNNKVFDTFG